MVALWLLWFLTGGPERFSSTQPFIKEPAPLGTGETYGRASSTVPFFARPPEYKQAPTYQTPPLYKSTQIHSGVDSGIATTSSKNFWQSSIEKPVRFGNAWGVRETDPAKEYIEITVAYRQSQPINITGWKIKSATTGREVTIGTAARLPYSGRVNDESPIYLSQEDRAVITTGRSPTGVSFRKNRCTGYFEQFQDFTPMLPLECPRPSDDVGADRLDDACFAYLQTLPQCQAHVRALPAGISPECQQFITQTLTYNGCVDAHKNESGFHRTEWRVFLNYPRELWKKQRDTLLLIDTTGRTVDSYSY